MYQASGKWLHGGGFNIDLGTQQAIDKYSNPMKSIYPLLIPQLSLLAP